ncbi:MAG: MFS transporter [Rhodospirillales bacterium]
MSGKTVSPARLIAGMFAATVLGMTGIVAYPALLPTFQQEWALSNTAAGWIGGVYFAGYVATVPFLSALTDRIDARRIVLFGMAINAIAPLGFALTASGVVSASAWWSLQGVGFAGIYLPGLKALSERVPLETRDRATAIFTATFTVGVGISFTLTGWLADSHGWRGAFTFIALGPVAGFALTWFMVAPKPPHPPAAPRRLFEFRPAFRNRRALAYSIAYAVHNGESAVLRAWIVALLVFAQAQPGVTGFAAGWAPTTIATVMTLAGLPAILAASELTRLFDRRRVIAGFMIGSALTGIAIAAATQAGAAFGVLFALVCFYGMIVSGDSGILNAGLLARAEAGREGTSMAVHALFGFTAAFLTPFAFGTVLDIAGGAGSATAWLCAFGTLAVLIAIGPIVLFVLDRE